MKRNLIALLAFLAVTSGAFALKMFFPSSGVKPLAAPPAGQTGKFDHSHASLTEILSAFVVDERVDYAAIKKSPEKLHAYLVSLAAVDREGFDDWSKDEQLAFLINAYNSATIALVVQKYPISSIKEIGNPAAGPWDQEVVSLFGRMVTLNHIEHEMIRANYNEPRAHFALVCASVGCPPLRSEAFEPERLSEQMDEQGTLLFATRSKNRVDADAGVLYLSLIFEWFTKDFVDKAGSVEKFVAPYFPEEQRKAILSGGLAIKYTDYDWSLNEQ